MDQESSPVTPSSAFASGAEGEASSSTSTPASNTVEAPTTEESNDGIKVYNPISESSTPKTELDDTFFEPTLSDAQSHHSSVLSRNKKLNEAPLLTSKHREAEKLEKERLKKGKWPKTTIRIKFSDGTIIQNQFPSDSPIQPVYEFIRTALNDKVIEKSFILYQPPRNKYPEHPIITSTSSSKTKSTYNKTSIIPPANYGFVRGSTVQGLQGGTGGSETLYELGLVPQSVLLVRWEDDDEMNASTYPAPIQDQLKAQSQPLPPSIPKQNPSPTNTSTGQVKSGTGLPATGEKKIPK
nr:uncharacterized protein I206_03474 [Kwoniella pini CBS 10737]OCF50155.1 hypothetical protein I206_03474 [Kwoniella pini CBS 10737]